MTREEILVEIRNRIVNQYENGLTTRRETLMGILELANEGLNGGLTASDVGDELGGLGFGMAAEDWRRGMGRRLESKELGHHPMFRIQTHPRSARDGGSMADHIVEVYVVNTKWPEMSYAYFADVDDVWMWREWDAKRYPTSHSVEP